jgi:hypothetical protein
VEADAGIVFVTTATGERHAALVAGPQVWTVIEAWQQHEPDQRTPTTVAATLGLTEGDVATAVAYWEDRRAEIDDLIARHHASQDAALASWENARSVESDHRLGR